METTQFTELTNGYIRQLRDVLGRFVKGSNYILMADEDEALVNRLVIELRDLFGDVLGSHDYNQLVVECYNRGKANYHDSPSYASIEELISIVEAANTRVRNNPQLLAPAPEVPQRREPEPLALPQTVTVKWLFTHVPYSFWITAAGLLAAAFGLGVTAVYKLQIVQQWMGLKCAG